MCSEACFTGKTIYIYSPENITGSKHRLFQQQLYTMNHARPLEAFYHYNKFVPSNPLNETHRIALEIKKKFFEF